MKEVIENILIDIESDIYDNDIDTSGIDEYRKILKYRLSNKVIIDKDKFIETINGLRYSLSFAFDEEDTENIVADLTDLLDNKE